MTILNMDFFLKLFAKALHEDFFLVKQEQQLGAHTGKYSENTLKSNQSYKAFENMKFHPTGCTL